MGEDDVRGFEVAGDGRARYGYGAAGLDGAARAADVAGSRDADAADAATPELPGALDYDLLAAGGRATVCATAPIDERGSERYQSEAVPETAFIEQLQAQAYEYVRIDSEAALIANLRAQLEALNAMSFTDAEWRRFFKERVAAEADGIAEKTRRIQEDHVQAFRCDDGTTKNVRLIDKKSIHNNRLQVMN